MFQENPIERRLRELNEFRRTHGGAFPLLADDGTFVSSDEELRERNMFFAATDGAEIPGSLNELIEKVDVERLREMARKIEFSPGYSEYLEPRINFYREYSSAVTVYSEKKRGFAGGRTLGDHVYVRGLNEEGKLLADSDYYISIPVVAIEGLEITKTGEEIHPKLRKQVISLVLASRIAQKIGKPYRRYSEHPTLQSMSPARLLDFGIYEELIGQIKEALYITEQL